MGTYGLEPAQPYVEGLKERYSDPWRGFLHHPTVFWWLKLNDINLNRLGLAGMMLSMVTILGVESWILQAFLWLGYLSIVTIAGGNSFFAYGWESQILETGFLCIFLCRRPRLRSVSCCMVA